MGSKSHLQEKPNRQPSADPQHNKHHVALFVVKSPHQCPRSWQGLGLLQAPCVLRARPNPEGHLTGFQKVSQVLVGAEHLGLGNFPQALGRAGISAVKLCWSPLWHGRAAQVFCGLFEQCSGPGLLKGN